MMKELVDGLFVSGQVGPAQLDAVRAAGVRSLVCNRPDGEAPDQPAFAQIAHQAQLLGMQAHYLPVTAAMTEEQAAQFRQLLESLPGPVLAYCRSGLRSATLWALSHASELGAQAVIRAAREAGYDLTPHGPRLAGIELGSAGGRQDG